jgi:Ca2+-binding RTX toxin-like protein
MDYAGSGSVDGGAGTDTVESNDLGSFSLGHVEILDTHGFSQVFATAAQLAQFDTITDSGAAPDSQILIFLRDGGALVDLSSSITGAHSAHVIAGGLSAGLKVIGSANGDIIEGSNHDDVLSGGAGNDTLVGNIGADRLTGGSGSDTFLFLSPFQGVDIVTDFLSGTDRLDFSATGFGGGLVADGPVEVFNTGNVATFNTADTGGHFLFDTAGAFLGTLYWDANGGSGADAVAFAKLSGVNSLSSTDFHLV